MMDINDNFYDQEKGEFKTGDDMKLAHILGDDIDNPKYTFRLIESITDKRIDLLSKKFYEVKKVSDSQKGEFDFMEKDMDNIFDNTEQELYYRIKTLFDDFEKQNNNLNSQNLLLQKYLTQLTKEKMDLLVQAFKIMFNSKKLINSENLKDYIKILDQFFVQHIDFADFILSKIAYDLIICFVYFWDTELNSSEYVHKNDTIKKLDKICIEAVIRQNKY